MNGTIDLDSDTFKVALVNSSYTPNIDTDVDSSDITGQVTGDGYTAGGRALSGVTVSQDNTNNKGVWDGANVIWANSTLSAAGAIIYDTTAASALVCYFDFSGYKVSSTGTFTISWSADGIISLA